MVPRYSDTIIEVLCLNSNILSQTYEDFGCSKYHSVTTVLPDLGLPSFDTVVFGHSFSVMWINHNNAVVKLLRRVRPYAFM